MKPELTPELKGQLVASTLVPADEIVHEEEDEMRLLRATSAEASRYIRSFSWCGDVLGSYFGGGIGKVFAVFLFHIRPAKPGVDPWIWIVVGDIPSAYLPISDFDSPKEVFLAYINGMMRWVKCARNGGTGIEEPDIPPVNVPPTPEWAEDLSRRLDMLIALVGPFFGVGNEGPIN